MVFMLSFRQYNVFSLTSIRILFDHIQIICLNNHACYRVNAYPSFKAIVLLEHGFWFFILTFQRWIAHCTVLVSSVWCICIIIKMYGMTMLPGMQKVAL